MKLGRVEGGEIVGCMEHAILHYMINQYLYVEIDICHSRRIGGRIFFTQIQFYDIRMQDPLRWSWSILFQVTKNQKSYILNIFFPIHQVGSQWITEIVSC